MLNRKAPELDLCDVTPTASPPRCHPASPAPGGPARGHQGGRRGRWWEQGASSRRVMLGSDGSWMHVKVWRYPTCPAGWRAGCPFPLDRLLATSQPCGATSPLLLGSSPAGTSGKALPRISKSVAGMSLLGLQKGDGLSRYTNPALTLKSCPAAFGAGSAPALSPAQIPYPPPGASHLRQHPGGKAAVCLDGKNKS